MPVPCAAKKLSAASAKMPRGRSIRAPFMVCECEYPTIFTTASHVRSIAGTYHLFLMYSSSISHVCSVLEVCGTKLTRSFPRTFGEVNPPEPLHRVNHEGKGWMDRT